MSDEAKPRKEQVRVVTSKGTIEGYVSYCNCSTKFYCFERIPYAQVPEGPYRFLQPLEVPTWYFPSLVNGVSLRIPGGDNILLLEIFTPEIRDCLLPDVQLTFDRPVIVFVPGVRDSVRGRKYDIFDKCGAHFLMEHNIVLVVISYRLGTLGFLKFNDPQARAPGDVGLLDICMAFKWVRKEIGNFGGNPANITAFGQTIGATHIRRILTSQYFENCFDKVILSGCLEDIYMNFYTHEPQAGYITAWFSGYKGPFQNDMRCVEYLRNLSITDIRKLEKILFMYFCNRMYTKEKLLYCLKQQYPPNIPVMIGYNSFEETMHQVLPPGTYPKESLAAFLSVCASDEIHQKMMDNIELFVAHYYLPEIRYKNNEGQVIVINGKIKSYELVADFMYIMFIMITARILANTSPGKVYIYRMNVPVGVCNIDYTDFAGTDEGIEMKYLFKTDHSTKFEKGSQDYQLVQAMTQIWTQFARTGDPNVTALNQISARWEPIGTHLSHCVEFSRNGLKYCGIPETARMKLWELIYNVPFFSSPSSTDHISVKIEPCSEDEDDAMECC